ncbi:MAG: DegV family protein [Anaerolineae bacterium]|nr:DegV family protein [Anaerolineae bacterium]MDW8172447.1 DegV family protein [Anaerolineae bacterium]
MKQRIRIITDSVCDLPSDLVAQHNIVIIPCFVNFDGQSYADDGHELDRSTFYQRIPQMKDFPKTSAPPPSLAEKILREALEGYDYGICIHVPSAFSATLNNVKLGGQTMQDKLTFIDSQTLSMGIGLQALIAAEVAAETGDTNQVLRALEAVQRHQRLYAVLATLDFLRRSGRVNPLLASIGTLLQLKPVVSAHDSIIEPIARIRTFSKAVDFLYQKVMEQAPFERLFILHIQNEAGALALRDSLGQDLPADTSIIEVGPTLGTHIGPGSLGAVTLPRHWKQG